MRFAPLIFIGPNPALQQTVILPNLVLTEVNRASVWHLSPGGKGIHANRAANTLMPNSGTVFFFYGGKNGKLLLTLLRQRHIPYSPVPAQGETRSCLTLLDSQQKQATEIVGPSSPVSVTEVLNFTQKVIQHSQKARGIIFCGTTPPGMDIDHYNRILSASSKKIPIILDAYQNIYPFLQQGKIDLLKINLTEFLSLMGSNNFRDALHQWIRIFPKVYLAITDGPRPAYLWSPPNLWSYQLPKIEGIVNPIGAGDTCTGVIAVEWILKGTPLPIAFQRGLGAAIASCLHLEGAEFELDEMEKLTSLIMLSEERIL